MCSQHLTNEYTVMAQTTRTSLNANDAPYSRGSFIRGNNLVDQSSPSGDSGLLNPGHNSSTHQLPPEGNNPTNRWSSNNLARSSITPSAPVAGHQVVTANSARLQQQPELSPGIHVDNVDLEDGKTTRDEKRLRSEGGGYDPQEPRARKPFLRTAKGLILLTVIALAIIAAAVGGGVGATVGKHNNNAAAVVGSAISSSSPVESVGPSATPTRAPASQTSNTIATVCTQDNCPASSPTTDTPPNGITQTPTANQPIPTSLQGNN